MKHEHKTTDQMKDHTKKNVGIFLQHVNWILGCGKFFDKRVFLTFCILLINNINWPWWGSKNYDVMHWQHFNWLTKENIKKSVHHHDQWSLAVSFHSNKFIVKHASKWVEGCNLIELNEKWVESQCTQMKMLMREEKRWVKVKVSYWKLNSFFNIFITNSCVRKVKINNLINKSVMALKNYDIRVFQCPHIFLTLLLYLILIDFASRAENVTCKQFLHSLICETFLLYSPHSYDDFEAKRTDMLRQCKHNSRLKYKLWHHKKFIFNFIPLF